MQSVGCYVYLFIVIVVWIPSHCELSTTLYTLFVGLDMLLCGLVGRQQHPRVRVYLHRHELLAVVQ